MAELERKYPIKGMTVMPEYMGELPFIEDAFTSCVIASLAQAEVIRRFEEETKMSLCDLKGPNQATVFASFADWIATNVWGTEDDTGKP